MKYMKKTFFVTTLADFKAVVRIDDLEYQVADCIMRGLRHAEIAKEQRQTREKKIRGQSRLPVKNILTMPFFLLSFHFSPVIEGVSILSKSRLTT
jgi:hypothetical protein